MNQDFPAPRIKNVISTKAINNLDMFNSIAYLKDKHDCTESNYRCKGWLVYINIIYTTLAIRHLNMYFQR
jgi:hypothetical protein